MRADLNAVELFLSVAETKNFRRTALSLGVPKSTVSAKVARLEERLGVRLFERTTRTLRLTDAGNVYYREVAPALEALGDAERLVGELQAEPKGRLRLTTAVEFGQNSPVVAGALAEYLRRYPGVRVELDLVDRQVDLISEGYDLAIRAGELPDSSMIARRLGSAAIGAYASPEYLQRRGRPKAPRELRHHDCMAMTARRQPAVWHFAGKRSQVSVEVEPRVKANSFLILRALAVAGHGIALLPAYLAAETLRSEKLELVLEGYSPAPTAWHAVYPSARHLSPKVRAFVEILERHFAGDPEAPR